MCEDGRGSCSGPHRDVTNAAVQGSLPAPSETEGALGRSRILQLEVTCPVLDFSPRSPPVPGLQTSGGEQKEVRARQALQGSSPVKWV